MGVDFGGWWVVDILSRPRVGSIFNVSRHFSYPRDAKFCDEYASKGLVFITSLLGGEGLACVVDTTLPWSLSSERLRL